MDCLSDKIETLRLEMHELATQRGFRDDAVILLSQKLDQFIVEFYKEKRDGKCLRYNKDII